jgi:hypothetical protein
MSPMRGRLLACEANLSNRVEVSGTRKADRTWRLGILSQLNSYHVMSEDFAVALVRCRGAPAPKIFDSGEKLHRVCPIYFQLGSSRW